MTQPPRPAIAVIIPCYNEAVAIGRVVDGFRAALPEATIYVFDNNSTDASVEVARARGAIVRAETLQGKGNVVRRMFADVEADVYVLVDGDATYDPASAPALVERLLGDHLDMVTAVRISEERSAYRPGHRFGNRLISETVARIFGDRVNDLLSGYRVFSRRFVKSFPAMARGFEIETELTVHALELRMPIADVPTPYFARPEGSSSKLNTFKDGFRILKLIVVLIKEERPLRFFTFIFAAMSLTAVAMGVPLVTEFLETGLVPRFPTAILATGLMMIAFLSLACGLILDTVTRGRQEAKRMHYLSIPRDAFRRAGRP